MTEQILTQQELKKYLHYDSNTGIFTWIFANNRNMKIGDIAGCLNPDSYIRIRINRKAYPAHRLAWLYMTGCLPKIIIDHINGVRDDNRFCNLRECNYAENSKNAGKNLNNTSGFKGVSWRKANKKWQVSSTLNGVWLHLGYFSDINEANIAYRIFAKKNHGDFYNDV